MLFRFSRGLWLGIHLGMTGRLRLLSGPDRMGPDGARDRQPPWAAPVRRASQQISSDVWVDPRHAHLVLHQRAQDLVLSDPRLFGRVLWAEGSAVPRWWAELPAAILSEKFTAGAVAAFLRRRARAPIKAVLLLQERFPGIGNWMADEILWRAGIHPRTPAGALSPDDVSRIRLEARSVARSALCIIGREERPLPSGWLFHQRWEQGMRCPKTGVPLVRERIGGRTTCWSPGRQPERSSSHRRRLHS